MLNLSVALLLHLSYFSTAGKSVPLLSRDSPKVKNFIAFLALTMYFKIINTILAHTVHISNRVAEAGLGVEVIRGFIFVWCHFRFMTSVNPL